MCSGNVTPVFHPGPWDRGFTSTQAEWMNQYCEHPASSQHPETANRNGQPALFAVQHMKAEGYPTNKTPVSQYLSAHSLK